MMKTLVDFAEELQQKCYSHVRSMEEEKKANKFLKCEWKEEFNVAGHMSLGGIGLKSWYKKMEGKWQE